MKKILTLAVALGLVLGFASGCATTAKDTASAKEANGSRLWTQNCARCHNSRSPSSYSDAQWEVAMLHMRVRANLTPVEHQAILEFLQSGNP